MATSDVNVALATRYRAALTTRGRGSIKSQLPAGIAIAGMAMGLVIMRVEVIDILRAHLSPMALWIIAYATTPGLVCFAFALLVMARLRRSEAYHDEEDFFMFAGVMPAVIFSIWVLLAMPLSHTVRGTAWAGQLYASELDDLGDIAGLISEGGGSPTQRHNEALLQVIDSPNPDSVMRSQVWSESIVTGGEFSNAIQALRMTGYIDEIKLGEYRNQGWISIKDLKQWMRHAQGHPPASNVNLATQQAWAMLAGHRVLSAGWTFDQE